jgi:hypothetical protein
MARNMKAVSPARDQGQALVLTIQIDPLRIPRGAQRMPRGGAHRSARHPARARARQQLLRQLAES